MTHSEFSPTGNQVSPAEVQTNIETPAPTVTDQDILARLNEEIEKRRRAEERYRVLFHQSPAMLVNLRNHKGTPVITDCNKTFLETLGYKFEEAIGRSLLEFFTPGARQAFYSQGCFASAMTGKASHVERDLVASDGHIVTTLVHVVADVPDANGRPNFRAMFVDVTERKLAEEARSSIEKKFLSAFMYSPVPMVITSSPENIFIDVNQSFLEMTKLRRQDLIGEVVEKGIDLWNKRENYSHFLDEFERNDRVRNFETEYELATGESGFALISSELIAVNEQTCVLSTIQDITQRKLLERSLRGLATRLQAISAIEHSLLSAQSPEAVAQVALQHLSLLLPVKLAAVYHFDKDLKHATVLASNAPARSPIATGQSISCPVTDDKPAAEMKPIYYVSDIARLPDASSKYDVLTAEGVRSVILVLFVVEERVIGAMHVGAEKVSAYSDEHLNVAREVADLLTTAIHQANLNQELKTYTDRLEEKVAARTAELHLANAELARANRLKDEFLANMSHELRTPLSSILAKSEVLQEGVFGQINEKQGRSLQVIEQSGRHLLGLINDILDLAKIGSGQMELNVQPANVHAICDSSLEMVQDLARKKRLQIEMIDLDESLVIEIDPQRLKQMLVNLLSNAVKFTPEGGRIGLVVAEDEPSGAVHFTVWDTGIGIAQDMMGALFTPFVQLEGGLARQYEGTGLGLALVSRLAKLHGGTVSVESEVGAGSRFTISLPFMMKEREPQPETAESRGWYYDEQMAGKRPFRLLLAEDNLLTAETYSEYLEHLNYPVSVAYDGQTALDLVAEIEPDLILMDIQMPGMDGLEAIRRIRAQQATKEVPIIAITALAMPGDRERCLRAGATEYVSKPIAISKLRELVQKYEREHNR